MNETTETTFTTTDSCSACNGTLDANDGAYHCAGFCNKAFHEECLGLTPAIRKELFRNPQLLWVCPGCSDMMGDGAAKMKNVVMGELSPMLDQMRSVILAEFDRRFTHLIELSHPSVPDVDHRAVASQASMTADSVSFADVIKDRTNTRHHPQTTVAPTNPPLVVGTASKTLVKTVPAYQPKLWLFFSRLTRDTTDEQVADMVHHCLGVNDVLVRRLLARDRDVTSVPFLSFKVGVPLALRERALDPATWPHGVSFREFVDRPRLVNPATKLTSLAEELAQSAHVLANRRTPSPPSRASLLLDNATLSQLRKRPRDDIGSANEDD
ncbi:uncharacterized protein LOC126576573 [Anopheles aquasalis]|uniref:uncharacterized protein LOC126576573 n=1 Tax=Anopheles aquasalis TaxID=42839 RepID=UPI00215B531C|nr:uncharacterized protein LOC126576573 [Anopheles aquasalis]